MGIGTSKVCHMAFVTKDIYKFTGNWAKFAGIDQPKIWAIPSKEIAPAFTLGKLEEYTNCLISIIEFENIVMEVVQPGEEPNPWKLCLDKYGEGFQHISFVVPDPSKAEKTLHELGVDTYYHIGYYDGGTYSFYDTHDVLGMEVNIKYNADNGDKIAEISKEHR